MKEITSNAIRTVLTSVPPIVLFMGGVVAVCSFAGLRLLEMLQNAA